MEDNFTRSSTTDGSCRDLSICRIHISFLHVFFRCDFSFRGYIKERIRGFVAYTFFGYIGFGWSFQKTSCNVPRRDICRDGGEQFGELAGHCFFWIICIQFACRHCWVITVCTERHASRWIWHSVRQQSAAVFTKLWKRRLINSFNYCWQNINTKIMWQWHYCRVKLALLFFASMNEN